MRFALLAGEQSGDILGADLIAQLKVAVPDASFSGLGGPKMIAQGLHSLASMERLMVMGFVEPLARLPELLALRRRLARHFLADPPDVFIGIDAPSFNLSLEGRLRRSGIPVVHYVSPQVWAWRRGRLKKIAHYVDQMLCLYPFEEAIYKEHDIPARYVGHPLARAIPLDVERRAIRSAYGLDEDTQVLAVLPGSRAAELRAMGEIFFETIKRVLRQRPKIHCFVSVANKDRRAALLDLMRDLEHPVTLFEGPIGDLLSIADLALASSGTVTLEAMLYKTPMVVCYRMAFLSYAIISRLSHTPWISLPNLLAGKPLAKEFIQKEMNPENLTGAVLEFLDDPQRADALRQQFSALHQELIEGPNCTPAEAVLELCRAGA